MTRERPSRLGKLPPQYRFVLNPHAETRVGRCPICRQKMRQRKAPLFIHVDPFNPVALGYTCRYCPTCDLLIAHQDEIERLLASLFAERDPSVIGNDYLVIGTVERAAWREGMKQPKGIDDMLAHLHDFKEVLTLEYRPAGWYPADEPNDQTEPAALAARPKPTQRPGSGQKRPKRSEPRPRKGGSAK
ncbi:MAG: hypothetical protein JXM73_02630 [Anaerolineae bacterium]|nr:hypothetical protein [Anaerolineae bacterium]